MSLPTQWVDKIFDKLTLTYGQTFLRRWQDIDLSAVKSDWAHELAGFANHPKAIAWALQNLPVDKPPTVLEFKFIARRSPPDDLPKLEAPRVDPNRIAAELEKLSPMKAAPRSRPNTDWAKRIVARHESGAKVPPLPLRMAREVLTRKEAA